MKLAAAVGLLRDRAPEAQPQLASLTLSPITSFDRLKRLKNSEKIGHSGREDLIEASEVRPLRVFGTFPETVRANWASESSGSIRTVPKIHELAVPLLVK